MPQPGIWFARGWLAGDVHETLLGSYSANRRARECSRSQDKKWGTMRIAPSERVVYEHNPLAEVLCQVRFERATASDDAFTKFHLALADSEYQKSWVEDTAEI